LREESRLRVLEKMLLRRIFGPKRTQVTEDWRKLHKEELHGKCHLPNVTRVIKLRRLRWMEHVELWGRGEEYTGFGCGNLRDRGHLEDPSVDGRIILRWIRT
jgi:hypothetical protein